MTTTDIEITLMERYNIRQNVIVPNVSWGITNLHECDLLILSKSNYATEIEIKLQKGDVIKDKEKKHGHHHNHIKYLYFAVPEKLRDVALEHIPERAGLILIKPHREERGEYYAIIVKKPILNNKCHQWTEEERNQLTRLGTLRIYSLKKRIAKLTRSLNTQNEMTKRYWQRKS